MFDHALTYFNIVLTYENKHWIPDKIFESQPCIIL